MTPSDCPFCNLAGSRVIASNEHALAIPDGFPLSQGHSLVVPREHSASVFELSAEVQAALWRLVAEVRRILAERHVPESFNIGVNDGPAAGQTVPHAHIHVIPRWRGDVTDPRGGVRWVIPDRAAYWIGER